MLMRRVKMNDKELLRDMVKRVDRLETALINNQIFPWSSTIENSPIIQLRQQIALLHQYLDIEEVHRQSIILEKRKK